jgi:UDP-galactopyranose mutase
MPKYDYLIVGAGFFGATFARLATDAGKSCLIIESRNHIAGNAYTERVDDIDVHVYGPHIFHTDNLEIWQFVNRFSEFNNYVNRPKAMANGKLYSLPFNMNTFYQLWGCTTPGHAQEIINKQRLKLDRPAENLEEQALSLVGQDIYELLIRDYTRKQWKADPKDLAAFIIKRLPLRFTYDDNYFNDRYQGIPVDGYTALFESMLKDIPVELNVDYFDEREYWGDRARKIVFTGRIDEFFDYTFGELEYRTLDFQTEILDSNNYQGTAVINYPEARVPWTRVIEHRHFNTSKSNRTVVTKEIPAEWSKDKVPYYPINNDHNDSVYQRYRNETEHLPNFIFGGRLAEYRYYDMHQVIGSAMKKFRGDNIQ